MRFNLFAFLLSVCLLATDAGYAQDHPYGPPKLRAQAFHGWEFHAAASTSIPAPMYWTVSESYLRADADRFDRRFIRDDGTVINVIRDIDREDPDPMVINDKLYQLGANYVTRWGGVFRTSFGFYRTRFRLRDDEFRDLRGDEVRLFTDAREQSVIGEVGFQYNFFRSRRFRPYLGAAFTTHLYYKGEIIDRFIEGDTGQTGLVSRFYSTERLPIYPDFSLTAGFQYQLMPRLSAGAFVWANSGADLWLDAPLGVEIRYSLNKRPLRKLRGR